MDRITRPLLQALLYASLALAANAAAAAGLGDALRDQIADMRSGDMQKLVIHAEPRPVSDTAFFTKEGAEVRLSQSDGKVRIVNFWATWCAPCRAEKPSLDALNAAMEGADFEVIAIATGRNSEASIERFNTELNIRTLHTYLDPKGALARETGVLGLPVSLILDRDGTEIARLTGGADWNTENVRAILGRIIAPD